MSRAEPVTRPCFLSLLAALTVVGAALPGLPIVPQARASWVGSWSAAPTTLALPGLRDRTVRQFLRLSLGGSQVRIRFSNEAATSALVIGAAHVALPGSAPGSIDPTTDRVLTFGGRGFATVPPGAPVLSDPVDLPVAALSTIAVSAVFTTAAAQAVGHLVANETAYLADGEHVADLALSGGTTSTSRFHLDGVEVGPAGSSGAIAVIGDSITDGFGSTPDRDRRWTDQLAARFAARTGGPAFAVLNGGVSGNRLLDGGPHDPTAPSALARLDRDILSDAGLRWIVVFIGLNDIGMSAPGSISPADIVFGYRQIIARAHDRGIGVVGATLTPFLGSGADFYSAEKDRMRQAVNQWIRTSGEFAATLDFDAVLRDPARPAALLPAFDAGDHIHPNDAGYRAMGNAVPLEIFR